MIKRVSLVRRKPDLTAEQFWAHYTGPHAAIVQRMPGLRRLVLSRAVGDQVTEWDAVGELWFDDTAAAKRAFEDEQILAELRADRSLFLGASEVVIVEEQMRWP
jgi:uncharacterized protein (TIGR02118 family)